LYNDCLFNYKILHSVNNEGEDLPSNKSNILEVLKGLIQKLNDVFAAHFLLKILETSEGRMFRLLFEINYCVLGIGNCEQKILSRPFTVYSNRKKHTKDRPVVIGMKPLKGLATQETEVWIKGRGFGKIVHVMFGERPAKVLDTYENLITVTAPIRNDILTETVVPVVIANKFATELFVADNSLTFSYS